MGDKFRKALRALFSLIGQNSELNIYNKLLLYTAVLRPILTYGSPVWVYAADSNIKILEVAQNSLIRNIVKADRCTRNSKIYEDIKILPFKNYIQKVAISFYNNLPNINNDNVKMLNNYIPEPDIKRPRRILLDSAIDQSQQGLSDIFRTFETEGNKIKQRAESLLLSVNEGKRIGDQSEESRTTGKGGRRTETEEKNNSVPVTTPPCHVRTTNQDTLYQAGPLTSGHIYNLDTGWRNASRSISQ
ncbi:RNA-directed DNA polymerase from mobile element jockey [Trichonephila clavipes]|nr:RNA-directed DNA polymerase from mobile element jockey [Trichonephila clavipes]